MKYFFAMLFLLQFLTNSESSKKLARENPRKFFKRFGVNIVDHPKYFVVDTFNIAHSRLNQIAAREFVNNGKQIVFIKGGVFPDVDLEKFDVCYLPDVAGLVIAIQLGFTDQYFKFRALKRTK